MLNKDCPEPITTYATIANRNACWSSTMIWLLLLIQVKMNGDYICMMVHNGLNHDEDSATDSNSIETTFTAGNIPLVQVHIH